MCWKECSVSDLRLSLVNQILLLNRPVSVVAREFGVSRKTAYKWLSRYQQDRMAALVDRSRRPKTSHGRTDDSIEQSVVKLRQQYNYGPRKIHRLLTTNKQPVPSIRTVATILSRRGCVGATTPHPAPTDPQFFERSEANELWQLDHKGPIEVARQKVTPLTVLDDHSRYCLRFMPVLDVTVQTAWKILWDLMGEVGMPQSILCDNAFGRSHTPVGISWFDARLVRCGIRPTHGRPRHPQTQGKVERLHGSIQRELIDFNARRDHLDHFSEDCQRWRTTYNTIRPHEALNDLPPVTRWKPSDRPRPEVLPEVSYASDAITRTVSFAGDFRYRNARILVGRGIAGQQVRIEVRERDIAVYYAWKELRVISNDLLCGGRNDKMV
jgi:transposase InsO family protein